MGGNALKACVTRRYSAAEYNNLVGLVANILYDVLTIGNNKTQRFNVIKSYADKETFGDMDILVGSDHLAADWQDRVIATFKPKQWFKNGNCFSFEYREFQIDLILTPGEHYDAALNYYAFNDMGNFLGRIAHSMGVKLGHEGLSYKWTIGTHEFKKVILMDDWSKILPVLGYDPAVYSKGFNKLTDIFEFVASGSFFNPDLFNLEDRNHAARARDQKRKTYTEFLRWMADGRELYHYPRWAKEAWLSYLFSQIPGFQDTYALTMAEREAAILLKSKYNGELVREWTGLVHQQLGKFMAAFRESHGGNQGIATLFVSLDADEVKEFVLSYYRGNHV